MYWRCHTLAVVLHQNDQIDITLVPHFFLMVETILLHVCSNTNSSSHLCITDLPSQEGPNSGTLVAVTPLYLLSWTLHTGLAPISISQHKSCIYSSSVLLNFVTSESNLTIKAYLFRITIEVEIDHNIPGLFPANGPSHTQHLSGQHPKHEADRVGSLVVTRDGQINVSQWRVSVA